MSGDRNSGPDFSKGGGLLPAVVQDAESGDVLMTAYMSAEQARGLHSEIDVRTDVHGLGVLGYELLAGRLPHDPTGRSLPESLRAICEDDPEMLGSLDRRLRGDAARELLAVDL